MKALDDFLNSPNQGCKIREEPLEDGREKVRSVKSGQISN